METGRWSQEEHASFLVAIKLFPLGPWRKVAAYIGTRSIRQVQTHAQKYHEKVVRRMRGLHKGRRSAGRREHRIDDELLAACKLGQTFGVVSAMPSLNRFKKDQMAPFLLDWRHSKHVGSAGVFVNAFIEEIRPCDRLPTLNESLDFLIESFTCIENPEVLL